MQRHPSQEGAEDHHPQWDLSDEEKDDDEAEAVNKIADDKAAKRKADDKAKTAKGIADDDAARKAEE